jgi:histidine triad (HIT) family protein
VQNNAIISPADRTKHLIAIRVRNERKKTMDCIFCMIIDGKIPSSKVYEDDKILAFNDINPQAPVHIIVIPKAHIESANAVNEGNADVVAHIFACIPEIAKKAGLENGYRVITNCGPDACQSVKHLHFHVIGGAQLADKMA